MTTGSMPRWPEPGEGTGGRDGPIPVTGARTCWHSMRSPVYDVMPRQATCNLAIIWPGPQLPFRDNTLDGIPPHQQTRQGSRGHDYSRPPAIKSFRSSATVRADSNAVLL